MLLGAGSWHWCLCTCAVVQPVACHVLAAALAQFVYCRQHPTLDAVVLFICVLHVLCPAAAIITLCLQSLTVQTRLAKQRCNFCSGS
jgi:hypothetical protein